MLKKIQLEFNSLQIIPNHPNKLIQLVLIRNKLMGIIIDPNSSKKDIKEAKELIQLISFCFN
jgi:hypothetical protein